MPSSCIKPFPKNVKPWFILLVMIVLTGSVIYAQTAVSADSTDKPNGDILKKLKVSGTIRTRYTASFNKKVGIDAREHSSASDQYTANAFTIPQARVVLSGDITSKMDVYVRVNFADFANSPQSRVLEYAYTTYHFNPYLNFRAGVFRPYFGREDDVATDFLKSFDYSNQYTAFDENGWMNYQMGISLSGEVKAFNIPVKYFAGIYNGNRRNNFTDNDNGKQIPARLEFDFSPDFQVGVNGGFGKDEGNKISAWGLDVNYEKQLDKRWRLEIESEFKEGNNQALFLTEAIPGKTIGNYMMRGLYVLPSIQYHLNSKEIKGLEASFKYETLDPNFKQNGNVHQAYVPMLGVDVTQHYAVRLQIGAVIERYNRNVENTTEYNSSRFITQLQIRF